MDEWPGIVGSEKVAMHQEREKARLDKEFRRRQIEAEANGAAGLLEMEMRYARDAESRIRDTNALDSAMYWGPGDSEEGSGGSMFWGATGVEREGKDGDDHDDGMIAEGKDQGITNKCASMLLRCL